MDRLDAWPSFSFRGFLLSGKLRVINAEDHAAHCRMARENNNKMPIDYPAQGSPCNARPPPLNGGILGASVPCTLVRIYIYIYIYIYTRYSGVYIIYMCVLHIYARVLPTTPDVRVLRVWRYKIDRLPSPGKSL